MSTSFNNLKILICDDSITNVMILDKLIETELGADVTTITDPRQAIPKLQETEFDLLLLDLEMPHMNGFEVLAEVRKSWTAEELPVIILTGAQGIEPRNKALHGGANDFINKPFDQTEVCLRAKNLLRLKTSFKLQRDLNRELERKVAKRTEQLNLATEALIHRLALAGELRDNETGQHVVRVGKYARILAEAIDMPNEIAFMIEKTAPLHDIGKIGIPDSILHKNGKLDEGERKIMNGHTQYGSELLGEHHSLLVQMAATIAISHHEKWDGSGYPDGKSGESIPIEGRITAIADVFDALTTERPYKQAWPMEKVLELMQTEAGKAFDPTLIEAFFKHIDRFLAIKQQYAD